MKPALSARQAAQDVALAVVCAAVVVAIQVFSLDAVDANRPPDALSVVLSIAAIAPLAVRRRAPLMVLIACFFGIFGLIIGDYSVGAAPVGVIIGFYTAVAWDTRANAQRAVAVVVLGAASVVAMRPADLGIEGVLANSAALAGCWVIGTGTRERRDHAFAQAAAADLQLALERERADLATDRASLAGARERLRISRELHDVLGHAFSVMVVQAGVAQRLLGTDLDESRRALAQISATGRTSLAELRGMVTVLREGDDGEPEISSPALADVPALVERVRAAGLPVELTLGADLAPFASGVQLAAYRIVQESLTNSLKHSGASAARVAITSAAGVLEIQVTDNGQQNGQQNGQNGGDVAAPDLPGHGLAGMRERVAIYGGELEAGPRPAGGYQVHARLPLTAATTTTSATAGGGG